MTERLGDLGASSTRGRAQRSRRHRPAPVVARRRPPDRPRGGGARAGLGTTRAREHAETVMPGTTHARFAQPVTLGHHLLAHAWAILARSRAPRTVVEPRVDLAARRRRDRRLDARARSGRPRRTAGLPPGVLELDRRRERPRLRPGVLASVAVILATQRPAIGLPTSRGGPTRARLGGARRGVLDGSSMMPQKRNPDTAELARGKAARVAADFVSRRRCYKGCRSGITATSRRTRNRPSTPPTPSSWCCPR